MLSRAVSSPGSRRGPGSENRQIPRSQASKRHERSPATSHQERPTSMSDAPKQDWTKPAAMAIPKGGFDKDRTEQGRYGPIFPKTLACYGFSILVKIIRGRE